MADTLTQLIAKVQALLLDTGSSYTTATCTAAIRQALKEFNDVAPRFAAETIDVVSGQREYELTGGDFNAGVLGVLSVHLFDDGGDDDEELGYTDYTLDNRVFIRLEEDQQVGELLLVGFSTPNTISGLDSATESTIPAAFDQVLVDGGAYYAICIRATGRVEPINLNKDAPKLLRESAAAYRAAFEAGKRKAAGRKARPAQQDRTWEYEPTEY
jgi:hypothetical protein